VEKQSETVLEVINTSNEFAIREILETEKECFGEGAINEWVLKPFVRYGKVFALKYEDIYIGFAELIKTWDSDTIYIFSFMIKKAYRSKGYGTVFLEKITKKIAKENIKKVILTVSKDNLRALKLYKKQGFVVEGDYKNEYGKNINRLKLSKKVKKVIDKSKSI